MSMGVKPILMTDVKDVADDAYSEDDEECYDDNELLGVIDEDEDAVVGVAGVAGVAGVRDPIDS
jgi:hypothetical protein